MSLIDYSKWDRLVVSSSEDESLSPKRNAPSESNVCQYTACCRGRSDISDRKQTKPERKEKKSDVDKSIQAGPSLPREVKHGPLPTHAPGREKTCNPNPNSTKSQRKRKSKRGDKVGPSTGNGGKRSSTTSSSSRQQKPQTSPSASSRHLLDGIPSFERIDKVPFYSRDTWGRPGKRVMFMSLAYEHCPDSVGCTAKSDTCTIRVSQRECQNRSVSRPCTLPKSVKVHPLDELDSLHPVFYGDPEKFVPTGPDSSTGHFEIWGLHDVKWFAHTDVLNRKKRFQHLYSDEWFKHCIGGEGRSKDMPEIQFVERLIERKAEKLANMNREFLQRDYIIKVSLTGVRPEIWRRFKVSGGVSLYTLQDKILAPIMGWCRDYHSYCFVDQSDGSVYGPVKSGTIDYMFVYTNGYKFFDDKKVQLGLVLQSRQDKLLFIYDLGDQWEHIITVEAILSVDVSDGACRVVDGAMHCPAEDSNGCEGKGNPYYQELLDILPKQKQWRGPFGSNISDCAKDKLIEAATAFNVTECIFDPFWFSVEKIQCSLSETVNSSVRSVNETKGKRKEPGVAICSNCANPNNLHLCSGCRMVYYCSRQCQREDWENSHKYACKLRAVQYDRMKALQKV